MPRRAPAHRPANAGDPKIKEQERKIQERRRKAAVDRHRGSAASRGYDGDWRRLRLAHIQSEPLCRRCKAEGRIVVADVVDHIVPISVDPDRRLDPSNLQSLCKHHHDVKTAREDGGFGRRAK
ncbi:HNH endonuclease (plasmid) [Skermanella sp. TT6]|uniref:Putative HNH nuclease YajD n=1 Tax=Skermanella cutis TaxID=2775420 RepID=A0ABX7BHD6_9PROT|nr:HNH endonuclease signature motif containing protein [Skermanella sp. TT6]QQP93545.1 HNH endonuclease [Skermanella sp. TT6]